MRRLGAAAALLALVASLAVATWLARDRYEQTLASGADHAASVDQPVVSLVRLATSGGPTNPTSPSAGHDSVLDELANRLRVHDGVAIEHAGDALRIVFAEGLFRAGLGTPTPDGADRLRAVAETLDAAPGPVRVVVEGVTDDRRPSGRGRWRDNEALARVRTYGAIAAMIPALRTEGAVALRPAGMAAAAPFPNGSPGGRARNRTVVLRVFVEGRA
ncbi:MAG: hypothetical protein HY271_10080 [Deltaproteobacteria bacterium]|nr:hypothetical protein [Deltaproteobacteria bacterium]